MCALQGIPLSSPLWKFCTWRDDMALAYSMYTAAADEVFPSSSTMTVVNGQQQFVAPLLHRLADGLPPYNHTASGGLSIPISS